MPDGTKPKFDPNKKFEPVSKPSSKPAFNPNASFDVVDVKKKDLSSQGSSSGLPLPQNTGQNVQDSGTPPKIYYYKEKPDNEYTIINNQWQRRKKGTSEWTPIQNESSINALNVRHKKTVPVPVSESVRNLEEGLSLLEGSGKGLSQNEARPLTTPTGVEVSGQFSTDSKSLFRSPKPSFVSQGQQQSAQSFYQGRKSDLEAAKAEELSFAQTPEQIAQVEQRYSKLMGEQDLNIAGAQLVPESNKEFFKELPTTQQKNVPPVKKQEVVSQIPYERKLAEKPKPYQPQVTTIEDRLSSIPNVSDQITQQKFEPQKIEDPFHDPEVIQRNKNRIESYRELQFKDLDEWRKTYGAGLNSEQFNELKAIQKDMSDIINDVKIPDWKKADLLDERKSQIEKFLDESKYVNQKFWKASLEGKSIEDVLYEDKKERMDSGGFFNSGRLSEGLTTSAENDGGFSSESLEIEKEIFDAEDNLRAFLSNYYGVGQGTFLRDPETGELKLQGFKSKEDEEYFNKKYKQYLNEVKAAKGKRFELINDRLVELYDTRKGIESKLKNADEGDLKWLNDGLKKVDSKIRYLNNLKRGVLLTEPKKILKEIAPDVTDSFKKSFSGLPDNLTGKQKFDLAYSQFYDRTVELGKKYGIEEDYLDQLGEGFRDWMDIESIGLSLSPEEKEFYKNKRILAALRPIYLNNDTGIKDENQGFWESFVDGVNKGFFDETAVGYESEREKARLQLQGMSELGVSEEDVSSTDVIKKLKEQSKEPDLASFEFAGQTLGSLTPLIVELAVTKKISAGALNVLKAEKNILSVVDAYDKAMKSTRFGRYVKEPLEEAVNAEIAGRLFSQEEELNFESFLLGGTGSKLIGSSLKKLGGEKAAQYISSIFGKNSDRAYATLEKMGSATSRGISEVGEESIQELTQIYNDELRDRGFWDEVETRFGSTDDIMKFVVSSFIMGSAFGMVESKSAREQYDLLSDQDKAIVDAIVSETNADLDKAATVSANVAEKISEVEKVNKKIDDLPEEKLQGEVSDESPIINDLVVDVQTDETGETEYKIDDKFYSEEEISSKLDDQKFIQDVNNGDVKLSVKNPSEIISQKISPTPNVQDFEGVSTEKETVTEPVKTKKESTVTTATEPVSDTRKTAESEPDQNVEIVTQEQFDDASGKTDQEIIQEANNIDDGVTPENKAIESIQKAIDVLPEGQAAVSNKAVFDGIIERAKEISIEKGLKGKKLIEDLSTEIESSFAGKITKEDVLDIQSEILAEIPKELKVSGKSVETITKDKFSAVSKAIRDKKFTSSMSDAMSQLRSSPIGVVTGVIDSAMEVVATTIDQAGTVAQAIDNGLQVVKESDWYKNLSDAGKSAAESLFKKNVRKQIDNSVKEKPVSKKQAEENKPAGEQKQEKEQGEKERAFGKKIMESEKIREEVKQGLSEDAKKYIPISNDVSIEEADAIITEKGADQAFDDVMNYSNGMDPRARVTLGMKLIEQLNASESEIDNDRAVQLADSLSQFATKLGQGVQAFAIWSKLSVGNIERAFNKKQKEKKSKFKTKNPELISGTKAGYDAGTGKAAKKAVNTVFGKNTTQAKKAKAFGMDKDQIDQRKKAALEKIRKASKGGNLTSGGINSELIEAITEYGFILFADGVRTFKEWSAKMRSETGVTDEDVLRSVWMNSNNDMGKSLNDLSSIASVENVVSDFFSKNNDPSKLSKKLQDTFGLDAETADGLAAEISDEFSKIVARERKSEIKRKTPRLTKKAEKAIDEIAGSDGLNKEQIEEKIFEAFGLGDMSQETADKISEMAKERDQRPEGFLKDEVTREMLSLIAKEEGIKAGDIFWSVWYASVLSGYETQILNITSNSMNIAMETLVTAIDKALLSKDPKAIAGSISGMANGMKRGWDEFQSILSKGYSPERLKSKLEIKDTLENTDFWGGKLNPVSYYKYVGRFMSAVDAAAFMASKGMRKQEVAREIAKSEGLKGEALTKRVSDLLNDSDQVYNDALYQAEQEINEIESRSGSKMTDRNKSRLIKARTNEIVDSKTDETITQEANKFAEFVTYNYDPQGVLGWAANGLSKAGEKFKPFKLIVPFTRIVANVLNQQIDYTPYGFIRAFGLNASHWSEALNSTEAKDARDRRRQLIKATMGTFLMVGIYMLAASYDEDDDPWFDITGKGPSDFNKRNQLLSQGWKPYHIKIGDTWVNYQYTPFGFAFSWIGNWRDNEKYKELSTQDATTKLAYAVQSSASGVMDMSFLTGLSGFMSALSTQSNPESISDKLLRSAGTTATSFVPNLFKQADKLYDPTVYDAKTVSEVILRDIPILKRYSGLKPKLNALGQPVEKMGNRFFTVENSDPVWQFMAKNKVFAPGVSPDTKMPDGTLMTDDQLYDYVEISGKIVYDELNNNKEYYENLFSTLDTDQKQKVIQKLFTRARKSAKGIVYLKSTQ